MAVRLHAQCPSLERPIGKSKVAQFLGLLTHCENGIQRLTDTVCVRWLVCFSYGDLANRPQGLSGDLLRSDSHFAQTCQFLVHGLHGIALGILGDGFQLPISKERRDPEDRRYERYATLEYRLDRVDRMLF